MWNLLMHTTQKRKEEEEEAWHKVSKRVKLFLGAFLINALDIVSEQRESRMERELN